MIELYQRFLYKLCDRYITERLSNNVYFQRLVMRMNMIQERLYKKIKKYLRDKEN